MEPEGACGGIEIVPVEMRSNVPAASCPVCLSVRGEVGEKRLSAVQIERIIDDRTKGKVGESEADERAGA